MDREGWKQRALACELNNETLTARVGVLENEVAALERDNAHLLSEFEDMRRKIEEADQIREEMTTLRDTLSRLLGDQ